MEAFLSRLVLEPRSRDVQKDLADVQRLHSRVMSGFPSGQEGARQKFGVLFRVDGGAGVVLLVQSRVRPTWDLPTGYLAADWLDASAPTVATTSLEGLFARCGEGAQLRFRLRANPTRFIDSKTGEDGKRRGKRVPLRKEESRLGWLQRKASDGGFVVEDVRQADEVAVPDVVQQEPGVVRGWRDGRRITLEGVVFEGRLRVQDAGRFRTTLLEGVGRGRAYGFGLLSVAPG